MSFQRSPLLCFEPATTHSPTVTRRGTRFDKRRRKRASTGESRSGFVLVDDVENAIRTAHYRFFVAGKTVAELQAVVFTQIRYPQDLDAEYEDIRISVAKCDGAHSKGAAVELLIQVTVARGKKWTSTGSDIYLYYLLELRKLNVDVVDTQTEVSSIVVDRIAAHHDYTLVRRCS